MAIEDTCPREKLRVVSARVLGAWDQKRVPLESDLVELARLAQDVARQPLGSHVVERLQGATRHIASKGTDFIMPVLSPAEAHMLLLALGVEEAP